MSWGGPATGHAIDVLAGVHGLDLCAQDSRPLTAPLIDEATRC